MACHENIDGFSLFRFWSSSSAHFIAFRERERRRSTVLVWFFVKTAIFEPEQPHIKGAHITPRLFIVSCSLCIHGDARGIQVRSPVQAAHYVMPVVVAGVHYSNQHYVCYWKSVTRGNWRAGRRTERSPIIVYLPANYIDLKRYWQVGSFLLLYISQRSPPEMGNIGHFFRSLLYYCIEKENIVRFREYFFSIVNLPNS